jgi:hypothetical protein
MPTVVIKNRILLRKEGPRSGGHVNLCAKAWRRGCLQVFRTLLEKSHEICILLGRHLHHFSLKSLAGLGLVHGYKCVGDSNAVHRGLLTMNRLYSVGLK